MSPTKEEVAGAVEYDDPEFCDDTDECWNCGGEGVTYSCFEEFACIDPEGGCDDCERRCDVCGGRGGFLREPSPSDTGVK